MHIRLFQFWLYTTIRRELDTLEGDSNAIDAFIRQVSDRCIHSPSIGSGDDVMAEWGTSAQPITYPYIEARV